MCGSCMRKAGSNKCTIKRGTLRAFRRELVAMYNSTSNSQLKAFLKSETITLRMLLRDMSFCPTTEYINTYKNETNTIISGLT